MAWIESHQTLRDHPKALKLARLLEVSRPAVIGHLQCLWWWATDYAPDGDLSRHDELDIAIGADWEGNPSEFVDALARVGFLDRDVDSTLTIHADRTAESERRAHAQGTCIRRTGHERRT